MYLARPDAAVTVDTDASPSAPPRLPRLALRRWTALGGLLIVLLACVFASLSWGSSAIPFERVWHYLQHPDESNDSYIVNGLRVTRTLIGILVGLALAVAGAVMQAVTRNPLADPGLLGVNSGASLAIVLGAAWGGLTGVGAQFALASVGAFAAAALVYAVGAFGSGGASPVRLVLAGVAFSAATGGIISMILLLKPRVFDAFRFWDVGALTRTDVSPIVGAVPIAFGLMLVMLVARGLTDVSLGDDVAAALGTNVIRVRVVALIALTLLCATATALAGPISFVGLMIPLACAWFAGPHRGWIIALSALAGPVLILAADVVGRLVARPAELQVGLLTAFVGSPVLLYMVFKLKGDRR